MARIVIMTTIMIMITSTARRLAAVGHTLFIRFGASAVSKMLLARLIFKEFRDSLEIAAWRDSVNANHRVWLNRHLTCHQDPE
jgi:hypothetical protein